MRTRSLMAVLASATLALTVASAAGAVGGRVAPPSGKTGGHAENGSARVAHLHGQTTTGVECPPGLHCQFLPAAYAQNSADPSDYGNYDLADRPADGLNVRYVVVHDTEEPYGPTLAEFQDSHAYVSAHYVIRSSDGLVTQMVPVADVAWQAGNWWVNTHSIGIEQEGFAIQGATWFSENLYRASAYLVRHLAREYGIPVDREHIVGHDDVPGILPGFTAGMHWDPGPYWDWAHFMSLAGKRLNADPRSPGDARVIMIKPHFASNQPPVTDCEGGTGLQPPQPASFVYLYSAPSLDAPLRTDAVYGPGTTCGNDTGDKADAGQQFVVAGQSGDFTGIWFNGAEAWFFNPHGVNSVPMHASVVTPKARLAEIPVYGRAYPEAAAYPAGIDPQPVVPVEYTIAAGQSYVATGPIQSDYYWAPTYTLNPSDHLVVKGATQYYQVRLGHRFFFVMASDVDVQAPG
jgi:N-acetyl-anhydromuramyl-L-alanine amidase AmpD